MRFLKYIVLFIVLTPGCTLSHRGSQAVSVDPFRSDQPALTVANDGNFVSGEPWNQR